MDELKEEIPKKKSTYTPALKRACYKWRKDNEAYRAYFNTYQLKQYHANKEKFSALAKKQYLWRKESKTFREILIDF